MVLIALMKAIASQAPQYPLNSAHRRGQGRVSAWLARVTNVLMIWLIGGSTMF